MYISVYIYIYMILFTYSMVWNGMELNGNGMEMEWKWYNSYVCLPEGNGIMGCLTATGETGFRWPILAAVPLKMVISHSYVSLPEGFTHRIHVCYI